MVALTTAGGEAMVPASPIPFTPRGFVVDGVSTRSVSNVRKLGGRRHAVVRHRRRHQHAVLVVDGLLVHRLGDALRDTAVHLALDDGRVDRLAAVVDRNVLQDVRHPRFGIDLDRTEVSSRREREVGRVEDVGFLEPGLGSLRQVVTPSMPRTRSRGWSLTCRGLPLPRTFHSSTPGPPRTPRARALRSSLPS